MEDWTVNLRGEHEQHLSRGGAIDFATGYQQAPVPMKIMPSPAVWDQAGS